MLVYQRVVLAQQKIPSKVTLGPRCELDSGDIWCLVRAPRNQTVNETRVDCLTSKVKYVGLFIQ